MGLETATYIDGLVVTNPLAGDPKNQGDDHLRLLKSTIKTTFPSIAGAVTPTHTELNYVDGVTSAIQTQIDTKGAVAGQSWTGTQIFTGATITVPTKSPLDNSTKSASTAYSDAAVAVEEAARVAAVATTAKLAGGNVIIGAQDLTGATVTVATPSVGANPTTKTYVDAAIGSAGPVVAWVSGNTYTLGVVAYSPINFQTYRHITATSSLATDPSLDPINWVSLNASSPAGASIYTALNYGGF